MRRDGLQTLAVRQADGTNPPWPPPSVARKKASVCDSGAASGLAKDRAVEAMIAYQAGTVILANISWPIVRCAIASAYASEPVMLAVADLPHAVENR